MKTRKKTQLSLFTPFMGEELLPDNEYVTYIETSSNNNNIVHKKNATSTISNNIEKSLNKKTFFRDVDNPLLGKNCCVTPYERGNDFVWAGDIDNLFIFMKPDYEKELEYFKQYESFDIRSHLSLQTA